MEHNSIVLRAQNATALQANIFLKVTLFTRHRKRWRPFFKRKPVLRTTAYFTFTICFSVKSGETFT